MTWDFDRPRPTDVVGAGDGRGIAAACDEPARLAEARAMNRSATDNRHDVGFFVRGVALYGTFLILLLGAVAVLQVARLNHRAGSAEPMGKWQLRAGALP